MNKFEKMIRRRVRGGNRADESRTLLKKIYKAHTGDNLDAALKYWNFI